MALHFIALVVCIVGSLAQPPSINIDSTLSSRIVGGGLAKPNAHPYIISLRYNDRPTCAGIIIDENYVITAAHCVYGEDKNPQKFKIRAGTNKLTEGTATDDVVTVEKITVHENYNFLTMSNDVAILKVSGLTLDNTKTAKIDLAEVDYVKNGESVLLVGWGSTTPRGEFSEDLQELTVETISEKACEEVYQGKINATQICTQTKTEHGACHGDSGGPLIRTDGTGKILIGIFSWMTPCARGKPDVFSKVSTHFKFFNKICECLITQQRS